MCGVKRLEIYEDGLNVFADVHYFGGHDETITWNETEKRLEILRKTDGYTIIEDRRV